MTTPRAFPRAGLSRLNPSRVAELTTSESVSSQDANEEYYYSLQPLLFLNTHPRLIPWEVTPPPPDRSQSRPKRSLNTQPLVTRSKAASQASTSSTDSTATQTSSESPPIAPTNLLDTTSYQGRLPSRIQAVQSPSISVDPSAPLANPVQTRLAVKSIHFKKNPTATPPSTVDTTSTTIPYIPNSASSSNTAALPDAATTASSAANFSPLQTINPLPVYTHQAPSSDMALFMQFMEWKNMMTQSEGSTAVKRKASPPALNTSDPPAAQASSLTPVASAHAVPPSRDGTPSSSGSPLKFKPAADVSVRAAKKAKVEDDDPKPDNKEAEFLRVTSLPSVCEVTDVNLQDDLLKDDYLDLPNCRKTTIVSWSKDLGPGNVLPSMWENVSDEVDGEVLYRFLSFRSSGQYVNLARVDPTAISASRQIYAMGKERERFTLCINDRTAICLSPVMITESSVTRIGRVNRAESGIQLKFVTGIFHSQEFERTMGVAGMAFHQRRMDAQIHADSVTFGTRSVSEGKKKSPSKAHSKIVGIQSSASQVSAVSRSLSEDSLGADDHVPVYDVHKIDFDPASQIESVASLPTYNEGAEIPENSLAVVAYTVNQFTNSKQNPAIGFNLRWVMVLGEPVDE
ncbi:hypothetical protein C8F04DRAFT_1268166 [Mycena alexandri]|uniref:Uncharacterized protein n=1 Tax=Mycena alexandri TaxID=1745969 RepID=A0AAD6WZ77_9AGAR|nr:hypothetical protein C8F04DRAFT_1268166 [Mycena alexandri]